MHIKIDTRMCVSATYNKIKDPCHLEIEAMTLTVIQPRWPHSLKLIKYM